MAENGVPRELMLIDGEYSESEGGEFISVENPSRRGAIVAEVPRANEADVDRAVNAAARAFESWRKMPARDRGRLLLKIADAVEAETETIARTIAEENGNAIRTQSRPEAKNAGDRFRYYGGLAGEVKGTTYPVGENIFAYTRREPLGVVAGLVPWNAPVQLSVAKIGPALAAGNTLVLKAASDAPLGVLKMAKIAAKFLPKGVLNVLTGPGEECGMALANHPLVKKISLTGSTEVGRLMLHCAANKIIPSTLELGGKNPQIVYPDADRDYVVNGVVDGVRFVRQGQSCSSGSRVYIHKSIFESFLEKLVNRLKKMKVGNPLDETSDIGAITSSRQFEKVCAYIKEGMNHEGVRLLCGGLPPNEGPLAEGYYIEPTVFTSRDDRCPLAREEVFGPVLVAIPWEDEEEVIRMANDTKYGLAAFVWTHDSAKGMRIAHSIEAGWVLINRGGAQILGHPYGGMKDSGLGREHSIEGFLESYTQIKSVMVNLDFPPQNQK